jgi:hypothetical protein
MSEPQFPWPEHVANIRERGVLGMQLFVVLTTPTAGLAPVLEHLQEHLAYQKQLEERGIMFAAGPFADDAGAQWTGEGMVIIRAASLAAAQAIAAADPMHSRGARTARVRPWLLNEGVINLRVSYSDGRREIS